jgi:hypothetical protein
VTVRRLELLQWFGFLFGGMIWFASFVAGAGIGVATCNPAGARWGIPYDPIQLGLLSFAVLCIGAAEAAAVLVFRETQRAVDEDPPPAGRMRLFAIGAMVGNLIFLVIVLLSFVAAIVDRTCQQA